MKYSNAIIGIVLGVLIWAVYHSTTGQQEPWDGAPAFYFAALFGGGIVSAFPRPSNWWKGVIGIYAGQWLYIFLVHGGGNLWPLGMVMSAIFMTVSAAGGAIVFGAWKLVTRKTEKTDG